MATKNGSPYGQETTAKFAEWLNMVMKKDPGILMIDILPVEL